VITVEHDWGYSCRTGKKVMVPQDRIVINGKIMGYIPHGKHPKILLIRDMSESEIAEVQARVVAKRGPSGDVEPAQVGVIGPPPEVPTESEDEDECE